MLISTKFKPRPVVRHVANLIGRDFIVGDIHGCFDSLETLLLHVGFDKRVDRLFSVGDYIDRGPKSYDCLLLRQEPWFFAINGNHEDMMQLAMVDHVKIDWYAHGGGWSSKDIMDKIHPNADLVEEARQTFLEDPYVIILELRNGKRINIVHSQLTQAMFGPNVDQNLDMMANGEMAFFDHYVTSALWSRQLYEQTELYANTQPELLSDKEPYPNISLTVAGHSFNIRCVPLYNRIHNHLWIDTASYIPFYGDAEKVAKAKEYWPNAALTILEVTDPDNLKFHRLNTFTNAYRTWKFNPNTPWQKFSTQ